MKKIGLFFCGLGCNIESFNDYYKALKILDFGMEVVFVCNPSLIDTLYNIALFQYSIFRKENEKFLNKYYRKIKRYLDDGYTVYIGGHSFGGAMVNFIMDKLDTHPNKRNLCVATFGSIYVSSNPNIINHMCKYDFILHSLFPIDLSNIVWKRSQSKQNRGHLSYSKIIYNFYANTQ